MATKNEGDPCYDAALPDEPMFVLLARDPQAPQAVRAWAAQRLALVHTGQRPASDIQKARDAQQLADRMVEWRKNADESWRTQGQLAFPPVSDGKTLDLFVSERPDGGWMA
jgi:hypothetical protein